VAILGAMRELGGNSEQLHRAIGEHSGQILELLIGVDGECRPLLNAAREAAAREELPLQLAYCEDAAEVAGRLSEWLRPGDVVLVKGSHSIGLPVVVEAVKKLCR
jgi:UDP-N-acetylmuramoyl-tripeptide--D-alanyl-D-alanine ligase